MSEPAGPKESPSDDETGPGVPSVDPVAALHRRRRLAEIFGDVLPESTSDDVPASAPVADEDRWYLENRPPHH
ncbi:MAG TPA: hypothetical protein VGH89_39085 [Pseudonocardia sp.]|jgi:hypothetical protein